MASTNLTLRFQKYDKFSQPVFVASSDNTMNPEELDSHRTLTNGLKEKLGLYTEPIEKPKVGNPNWRKPIPKPPKKVVEKT